MVEETIENKIHTIRGSQVMLDMDLAELYDVETRVFNQAVKRNNERFPSNFMFQLTEEEYQNLRSQFVTSSSRSQFVTLDKQDSFKSQNATLKEHGGRRYLPYVFTEQGVSMLSAVLRSQRAIEISIQIINAFVQMRKFISNNALIFQRLDSLEEKQFKTDKKVEAILNAIEDRSAKPQQGIFYEEQIKSAKENIVLIDNYIDDTVLTLFGKNQNIKIIIYTSNISKQLQLDFQKYSLQYANITLKEFKNAHDRFMIIDDKDVYHIGASLKDLGKKWFAFSRFEINALDILTRLENKEL